MGLQHTDRGRSRGRPRSQKTHRAILDAALEVLGERGFDGLTFEAIALRARVGRPTIYRRWKSKEDLVAEAIESWRPHLTDPDTGSIEGDIQYIVDMMRKVAGDPTVRRLWMLIMTEVSISESLRGTWWNSYVVPRMELFGTIIRRAVRRGEIDPSVDEQEVMMLLSSALLYHWFILPGVPTEEAIWKTINFILGRAGRNS